MNEKVIALKAAFPNTIPVLTGFSVLGIAYGFLMQSIGYGLGWTILMSTFVFAGSMQYVAIILLTAAFNPIYALLLTLMVNARHLFYGISLLTKFRGTGKLKPYLIFGLCDETFSILCSTAAPDNVNKNLFYFFVTLLNHSYWVIASILGSILGYYITFNTKGLEFVLTALFVVIFINQWREKKEHISALIGIISSLACLIIFGKDSFLIPAMICIIAILTIFQKKIVKEAI